MRNLRRRDFLKGLGAAAVASQVNPYQQLVLQQKATALNNYQSLASSATDTPPPDSRPLVLTSTQQFIYPQPGAAAVTIFSYTVPRGQRTRIFEHALVHIGGNPPDMTGNVIWRFTVNGAPLKGLGAQIAQIGTFATPDRVVMWLTENDCFQVTAEVVANGNIQAGSSAYRINGWTEPLLKQDPISALAGGITL